MIGSNSLQLITISYLPMQHIYITDYQWQFILIGTTSVLTNTQNVGTNANRCISSLCIYVLYRLFSVFFVECPLSDTRYWVIGHFRRYVTERLLNAKVVVFLGFLWFAVEFLRSDYLGYSIRLKKCSETELFVWKSVGYCLCTLICSFESCYIIPFLI